VPDDSAGKNARCPKCQSLMTVPAASTPAIAPAASSAPAAPASTNPFAGGGLPPPPKPAGNPFGDGGTSPTSLNPYASPAGGHAYAPKSFAAPGGPITNVVVPLDPIFSHAWRVWQENLGILVVTTLIVIGISQAIAIPQAILQAVFEHNRMPQAALTVVIVGNIVQQVLQLFLGIGQSQISLKLARGMPATIGDLFGVGPRFLPLLGATIIAVIVFYIGLALCLVPGILLALWFWPYYYLLVEDKAPIMESFSLAAKITEGNRLTSLVLALCALGIFILGCLALCIGLLFALPLMSMMGATAYLMMSGQLSVQPQYGRY